MAACRCLLLSLWVQSSCLDKPQAGTRPNQAASAEVVAAVEGSISTTRRSISDPLPRFPRPGLLAMSVPDAPTTGQKVAKGLLPFVVPRCGRPLGAEHPEGRPHALEKNEVTLVFHKSILDYCVLSRSEGALQPSTRRTSSSSSRPPETV